MSFNTIIFFITLVLALPLSAQELHITIISDSQQREILGSTTGFSAKQAQIVSHVAVRSSEQELFGKYVQRAVFDLEENSAAIVHLGDFLDYSCESEWNAATNALTNEQLRKLLLLPGNHDGLFQGNSEYGFFVKLGLTIRKIFNKGYDPSLQAHFRAICNSRHICDDSHLYANYEFRKRDLLCAYLKESKNELLNNNPRLSTACEFVENARNGAVMESIDPIINYANFNTLQAFEPNYDWNMSVKLLSSQTANWIAGYFIQAIKFKLSNNTLHLIMLDTNDWAQSPSFSTNTSETSSYYGVILESQQKAVEDYLKSIPPSDKIIFAGHYPFKLLEPNSANWLGKLITESSSQRMYISGHTHYGYIDTKDEEHSSHKVTENKRNSLVDQPSNVYYKFSEINADSLIDWPSSYWSMTYDNDKNTACFSNQNLWEKLSCESTLASNSEAITKDIKYYKDHIKADTFDQGEKQWLWRAEDAYRAMKSFIQVNKLDKGEQKIECETLNFNLPQNDFEKSQKLIAEKLQECQIKLDDSLMLDTKLRNYAACESILGSKVFNFNPKSRSNFQDAIEKRSNYSKFCLE